MSTTHDVAPYIADFYRTFLRDLDLRGARILEVGCGHGEIMQWIARDHPGVRAIEGINHPDGVADELGPAITRHVMDAARLGFEGDRFDLVYSLATFEHLRDPDRSFAEIARVLRPGGRLVAKWSPIWTGHDGHHYGPTLSHADHRAIALPWAHLVFDRSSLADYLERGEDFDPDEAQTAASFIYEDPWLNRVSAADFERRLRRCGLDVERLDAVEHELPVLDARLRAAVARGVVSAERVDAFLDRTDDTARAVYKMIAVLRKPAARAVRTRTTTDRTR